MAKLLVVEDDRALANVICDQLEADGHQVEARHTIAQARIALETVAPELLVLDWNLPDGTGIDLCRGLRTTGNTTLVLMLTGNKEMADKEEGFDAGADDYLTKPFDLKELSMRVRALLRRAAANSSTQTNSGVPANYLEAGRIIGQKYRLDSFLAQGGMSLIFRATHLGMGKTVVVKVLQAHLLTKQSNLTRFEQECRAMAKISNVNVAAIYDTGIAESGQPYLVMEYVSGESLAERLNRNGPLPLADALKILIQCCHGLDEVHKAGIVHRDLKPDNILLTAESNRADWVKIVDFGISHLVETRSRLTEPGNVIGTLGFMAPEQLNNRPVDCRADIYALGVILFEILTGQFPFAADTIEEYLRRQLLEQPDLLSSRRSNIPAGSLIELVAQKALSREPATRYQSTTDLRLALEYCLLEASST